MAAAFTRLERTKPTERFWQEPILSFTHAFRAGIALGIHLFAAWFQPALTRFWVISFLRILAC